MIKFAIITIFPDFIENFKKYGIIKQSIENNIIEILTIDIKKYSIDNKRIDDKPYGGGSGMILKYSPIKECIYQAMNIIGFSSKVIYLTPKGKILNNKLIKERLLNTNIVIICGRYKDIDERIILSEVDEEISIGDYVLNGGELPSMVLIESISRFINGVLKKKTYF